MPTATPDVHQILWGVPVTCFAFNHDNTKVAVSADSIDVQIWARRNGSWEVESVLSQHDKLVTGVDWSATTNMIVSVSQDLNAYVWQYEPSTRTWKHAMVALRTNRAATCVKWSPLGNKFAAGTGAKSICICYYDESQDLWKASHNKKHITSTVLSIDWHPDNVLIACGAADMKTRVLSAYIKSIDPKSGNPVWGDKLPLDQLCAEYKSNGWVHGVAFSPSGASVAWVAHDSTLNVSTSKDSFVTVKTGNLPLLSLLFLSEDRIVAAGHDCVPYLFERRGTNWELVDKLDKGPKRSVAANSAMLKFKQMDSRAQANADTEVNSYHQNTITQVRLYAGPATSVTHFVTGGVDGKLVIWEL
ncbi:WD40-repeat-containing domain protein [Cladochytrium replicatum]|nr:WD40-repeat-containing domain protein [Cladochytrium replicatum]